MDETKKLDRRMFLIAGGRLLATTPFACGLLAAAASAAASTATGAGRWGMVIDLRRCPEGCDACVRACRTENNVAEHGDERWDVHWIRQVEIRPHGGEEASSRTIPLLCNHCDHPPCAQVCPVEATYKRDDGIVIVDQHRCIGCRYCLIACPYNARFFNFRENHDWANKEYPKRSHGVAESCHLCAHRLDQGLLPACMEACRGAGAGAIVVGDLDDPESEISRLIAANSTKRIREDLGTEPKVRYIGL